MACNTPGTSCKISARQIRERGGTPKVFTRNSHCVPLPLAGAPAMMILGPGALGPPKMLERNGIPPPRRRKGPCGATFPRSCKPEGACAPPKAPPVADEATAWARRRRRDAARRRGEEIATIGPEFFASPKMRRYQKSTLARIRPLKAFDRSKSPIFDQYRKEGRKRMPADLAMVGRKRGSDEPSGRR